METNVNTSHTNQVSKADAVRAAVGEVTSLYTDRNVKDITLEEIELVEQDKLWRVTLSFYIETDRPPSQLDEVLVTVSGVQTFANAKYERKYKQFDIDVESGNVVSMKMRNV